MNTHCLESWRQSNLNEIVKCQLPQQEVLK